jgi:hypothetical protein
LLPNSKFVAGNHNVDTDSDSDTGGYPQTRTPVRAAAAKAAAASLFAPTLPATAEAREAEVCETSRLPW